MSYTCGPIDKVVYNNLTVLENKINEVLDVGDLATAEKAEHMYKNMAKNIIEVPISTISDAVGTITLDKSHTYNITTNTKSLEDSIFEQIIERLKYKPLIEHKCNNCGAPLKMDADNHLFKCRYCGTAYLMGTNQING